MDAATFHVGEGCSGLVTWCLVVAVSAAMSTGTVGPAVHARTRRSGLSTTFAATTITTTITTTTTIVASWLVVRTRSRSSV